MKRHGPLAALLLGWAGFAALAAPLAEGFPALGREVVALVRQHFYAAATAERWAAENADYAAAIHDAASFRRETRRRLAFLGASHTAYYTPDDPGYRDLLSIFEPVLHRSAKGGSLGLAAIEEDGDWFVFRAFPGGPGEAAGLRRGDQIVSAAGGSFGSLRIRGGRTVVLEVRGRRNGPIRRVAIKPRTVDPKQEWLQAQRTGSRIVERQGRRIGYVPVFACAGVPYLETLKETLETPLADAEALVIDLRGGWGGCDPDLVALFDPAVPDLTRIDRAGRRSVFRSAWRRPLVVLIDGGSRSGKELVARALQRSRRAVLVGERTAGAVLAGRPFLLRDGSLLFLAVSDIEIDGERLEGIGVTPDLAVAAELPYAEGRDPQLERALDVALERLAPKLPGRR
jgi:carboxyl-terminal processing protease